MINALNPAKLSIQITGPVLPKSTRCVLGEGLLLAKGRVAWVDIGRNLLYFHDFLGDRVFKLPVTATLILSSNDSSVLVASSDGFGLVNVFTGVYREVINLARIFGSETHRTNDGCKLSDGRYLVGTMHKSNPEKYPGSVHLIKSDGTASTLFEDIHIPNTFVELSDGDVLISDSHTGTIYRCGLPGSKKMFARSTWYQSQVGMVPDGGCRLSNTHIAIAMWGGGCIKVFENTGQLAADLQLPAKHPTNTKYCSNQRLLWVTSATEGLTQEDLIQFPLSGKTFCINNPLANICG